MMSQRFSIQEAADFVGCSKGMIANYVKLGALKSERTPPEGKFNRGRVYVIAESLDEVKKVIQEKSVAPFGHKAPRGKAKTGRIEALLAKRDDLFPLKDVAKALGKADTTLYGFLDRNGVKTQKVGGNAVLARNVVQKMADHYREEAKPAPAAKATKDAPNLLAIVDTAVAPVEKRLAMRIEALHVEVVNLRKVVDAVFKELGGNTSH